MRKMLHQQRKEVMPEKGSDARMCFEYMGSLTELEFNAFNQIKDVPYSYLHLMKPCVRIIKRLCQTVFLFMCYEFTWFSLQM